MFLFKEIRKSLFLKVDENLGQPREVRKIDFYNLLQSYKINDPCNWIGTSPAQTPTTKKLL